MENKGFAHIFVLLLLLIGLGASIYLIGQKTNLFSRASNPPIVFKSIDGKALPSANGISQTTSPNVMVELTSTLGSPISVSGPVSGPKSGTVSYRSGFDPVELNGKPFIPYTREPIVFNVGFKNTSGVQFYWVEFKAVDGRTDRRSAQIEIASSIPVVSPTPIPSLSLTGKGTFDLYIGNYSLPLIDGVISPDQKNRQINLTCKLGALDCSFTATFRNKNRTTSNLYKPTVWVSNPYGITPSILQFVGFDGKLTSGKSQGDRTVEPGQEAINTYFKVTSPTKAGTYYAYMYIDAQTCNFKTTPPDCMFYGGSDFTVRVDVVNSIAIPSPTPSPTPITSPSPKPLPAINPAGFLDVADCSSFKGWTCDGSNNSQSINVSFYADGTSTNGRLIGSINANQFRQDLINAGVCGRTGSHGYTFNLPSWLKDGRNHQIYAYGINIGGGNNTLLANSPKTIRCGGQPNPTPTPTPRLAPINPVGFLDVADCSAFKGWTCDGSNHNQSIDVSFYADGPNTSGRLIGSTTANQFRQDLINAGVCGRTGSHGYTFNLPSWLKDGRNHQIYAYGINIGGGNNTLLANSPKTIRCAVGR